MIDEAIESGEVIDLGRNSIYMQAVFFINKNM